MRTLILSRGAALALASAPVLVLALVPVLVLEMGRVRVETGALILPLAPPVVAWTVAVVAPLEEGEQVIAVQG